MRNKTQEDWFANFLNSQIRLVIVENVEVPDPKYPDKTLEMDIESVNTVSWARLIRLMDANKLRQSSKYKWELILTKGKARGRVAMNIYNALRGAARRRGGLYGYTELNKKEWYEAPEEWLKVSIEQDFTVPREDRDGKLLKK